MTDTTYNGWTNYETWNVALWINNDKGLYRLALEHDNYNDLAAVLGYETKTPDGVAYGASVLDTAELTALLVENRGEEEA